MRGSELLRFLTALISAFDEDDVMTAHLPACASARGARRRVVNPRAAAAAAPIWPTAVPLTPRDTHAFVGHLTEIRSHHGETVIRIDRHKPEDEQDADHRHHRRPEDVVEVTVDAELARRLHVGMLIQVTLSALEPSEKSS